MTTLSEAQLVTRYLEDGETAALDVLIARWVKPVYSFVYRYVGNAHDAEDITQEVFVKAWRHLRRYRHDMTFSTWLFTIARNTAIDWLRKKRPYVFSEFEDEEGENRIVESLVDVQPLADEMAARMQDATTITLYIKELPVHYREVVLMHYYEHLTFDEIAHIVQKPLNTIKSHHRRALMALKKLLNSAPNSVSRA